MKAALGMTEIGVFVQVCCFHGYDGGWRYEAIARSLNAIPHGRELRYSAAVCSIHTHSSVWEGRGDGQSTADHPG